MNEAHAGSLLPPGQTFHDPADQNIFRNVKDASAAGNCELKKADRGFRFLFRFGRWLRFRRSGRFGFHIALAALSTLQDSMMPGVIFVNSETIISCIILLILSFFT